MGQQVTQILKQAFPGMDVELDRGERQDLIRTALKEAPGAQFSRIGLLLTYTPREMLLMSAA